jgi:hypothetical protein
MWSPTISETARILSSNFFIVKLLSWLKSRFADCRDYRGQWKGGRAGALIPDEDGFTNG